MRKLLFITSILGLLFLVQSSTWASVTVDATNTFNWGTSSPNRARFYPENGEIGQITDPTGTTVVDMTLSTTGHGSWFWRGTDTLWSISETRGDSAVSYSFNLDQAFVHLEAITPVMGEEAYANATTHPNIIFMFNQVTLPAFFIDWTLDAVSVGTNSAGFGNQLKIGYWNTPGTWSGSSTLVYTNYDPNSSNYDSNYPYFLDYDFDDEEVHLSGRRDFGPYTASDAQNHYWFVWYDFAAWGKDYSGSTPIPIPGAVWLLGSGLVGLVGLRKKLKK